MQINRKRYLKYINPVELLRTKKVLEHNPTISKIANDRQDSILTLYVYNEQECTLNKSLDAKNISLSTFTKDKNYWLDLDTLNTETIQQLAKNTGLHMLIVEDILSKNQRPKSDEIDQLFTCVLHMLYYNDTDQTIESEQISFVLGKNFVITFQDDCQRDLFNPVRKRIQQDGSKVRSQSVDYLMYTLIDTIVDHYFIVLDKLALQIEQLEEAITRGDSTRYTMNEINNLRKEIMFFKRNVSPVRELIGSIIRSENMLIHDRTYKYFKDVYDHSIQANDLCDTYRDVISDMRDLYLSQMNLKLNEVMKFLAIVTSLLAPATVIGGIFGMNFDRIPYLHHQDGFWIATMLMIVIPILMLFYFKQKKWF